MTDMRGRRTRAQAPSINPAGVKMRRRVGGKMRAAHTHGAAAKMGTAATEMHGATTTTEVSTATAAPEVTAAATAADMSTAAAATTETAASGVSCCRQTKGKAYCGRACRDFPHDTTSSSGPDAQANARSPKTVPADQKPVMLQCTRRHCARRASIEMCTTWQPRQTSTA
jgi:hypothetical protein